MSTFILNLKMQNLAKNAQFLAKMAKNRTFLKMGPTDEFQTKISGFNIPFGYRNCKNLKCVLQLNWNIDAVYCDVYITCEMWRAMYMNYLVKKVHKDYE